MNKLPVPFSILNKNSSIKRLLEKYKTPQEEKIQILVGEKNGPVMIDLDNVGHLLMVGWTMSKKELILDAVLQSLMLRYTPEQTRLILFDNQAGLFEYGRDNPYLLTEVIYESEKVISALKWTAAEIDNRYKDFRKAQVRNILSYKQQATEKKPRIVFIIKTVDYLMDIVAGDATSMIQDIVSRGVSCGVHLILVTEKVTKKNIPPVIASNIPNRIICQVTTEEDAISTGIIDAFKLKIDEFYLKIFQEKPQKVKQINILKEDIKSIRKYFKDNFPQAKYTREVSETYLEGGEHDPLLTQAIEIIMGFDKVSASLLQRKLSIGYARAARLLDELEQKGYIGPAEGAKPREVLKK